MLAQFLICKKNVSQVVVNTYNLKDSNLRDNDWITGMQKNVDLFCEKYVKYRVLFCLKKMKSEHCIFQ